MFEVRPSSAQKNKKKQRLAKKSFACFIRFLCEYLDNSII